MASETVSVPLWQFCFPSKEAAEKYVEGINQKHPGYFETPEGRSRRFMYFSRLSPGAPGNSTVTLYYLALTAIEEYKSTETATTTTSTIDKKTQETQMSGHSGMNKRVYAPRPQTAPPGCKQQEASSPTLPPSQGSPLTLPKGNSNPGESKTKTKKQKALSLLPKKSSMDKDVKQEDEEDPLDPDMTVWEAIRTSPREGIIQQEWQVVKARPSAGSPKTDQAVQAVTVAL